MNFDKIITDLNNTVQDALSKTDLTGQEKADVMKIMNGGAKVSDIFSSINFDKSDITDELNKMNEIHEENNKLFNKMMDGFNSRK